MRPTRILGCGLIMALALVAATAWRSDLGRAEGEDPRSAAVSSFGSAARPTDPISSSAPEAPPGSPVEVVRLGLAAWGRFADSGDLGQVGPWFDPEGPQYARFVDEAAGPPVMGPAYMVDIDDPQVELVDSRALVSGRVTFVRPGEPPRTYDWSIVLHRTESSWRIWTVRSR